MIGSRSAGGFILVQSWTICLKLLLRLSIRSRFKSFVSPAIIKWSPLVYFLLIMLNASEMWSKSKDFFLESGLEYNEQQAIFCILLLLVTFLGVRRHHTASTPQGIWITVFVKSWISYLFEFTISAGLPPLPDLWLTLEITIWSSTGCPRKSCA